MRKEKWLDEALRQIRFFPDRKKVRRELEEHLEDRICEYAEMLEAGGMNADDACKAAEEKAVSSMGDPRETGRQLNREHKPLLGFLWLGSWILVVVMLCVAIGVGVFLCKDNEYILFRNETAASDYDSVRDSYIKNHYGGDENDLEYNVQVDYTVKVVDTKVTFHNFLYDNSIDRLVILLSTEGPGWPSVICNNMTCNGEGFISYMGNTGKEWNPDKRTLTVVEMRDVDKKAETLDVFYDFFGNSFAFEVDIESGVVKEVQ